MSLIPAFKIGLWNVWILSLPQILMHIITSVILKRRERNNDIEEELARLSEKEKKLSNVVSFLLFSLPIYSIFLPLKLGTAWFYVGSFVYLLGTILSTMADLSFVTTPADEPVTKGVFRISRHPMYFGVFLTLIGAGIACASWIFLLCGMVFIILMHILVIPEERWCLEKYGNAYREYMNRTPKWIGIPESGKSD